MTKFCLIVVLFLIQLFLRFFAILFAAAIANPYSLLLIAVVVIAFVLLRSYYLRTARDVKRLEALGMYMYMCLVASIAKPFYSN